MLKTKIVFLKIADFLTIYVSNPYFKVGLQGKNS